MQPTKQPSWGAHPCYKHSQASYFKTQIWIELGWTSSDFVSFAIVWNRVLCSVNILGWGQLLRNGGSFIAMTAEATIDSVIAIGHFYYCHRHCHQHCHCHCHGQEENNGHQSSVSSMVNGVSLIGSLFICPHCKQTIFLRFLQTLDTDDVDLMIIVMRMNIIVVLIIGAKIVTFFTIVTVYSPLGHSKETDSMAAAAWTEKVSLSKV